MNNDNIDDIYTAAYQTVEHYLDTFRQNKIFPGHIDQLGYQIRHELFPLVVQHLMSDVNTPVEVKIENFKRVIGNLNSKFNAFKFAEHHFKDQYTASLTEFFNSPDFKQLIKEIKTKQMPSEDEIKEIFTQNYKHYFWENQNPIAMLGAVTAQQEEHNTRVFRDYFYKIPTSYSLEDVLEYHKAHVQYLAGVAMEYINVMEQTMAKSIANASLKDRLTARRDGNLDADTITIETSEKGGMTR